MHPDADAFLDAIFANPGDDTPRLVYADWLEEHGHPDHAAFIRLQVEAARHRPWSAEANRLWEEIGPVWARLRDVYWLDDWPEWELPYVYTSSNIDAVYFQRGFLHPAVAVSTELLARHEGVWWPWFPTPTSYLELTSDWVDQAAECRTLERVRRLRVCRHQDAWIGSLPALLGSPRLAQLTSLDLNPVTLFAGDVEFLFQRSLLPLLRDIRLRLYLDGPRDEAAIQELQTRLAARIERVAIESVPLN